MNQRYFKMEIEKVTIPNYVGRRFFLDKGSSIIKTVKEQVVTESGRIMLSVEGSSYYHNASEVDFIVE